MIATANLNELQKLLYSSHGDPHHILGMHKIEINEKTAIVVRAFVPQAKMVSVYKDKTKTLVCNLKKVHFDGFFESIIPNCNETFKYYFKLEDYDGNSWTTYDPYSFQPVISDLDRHLFAQGTHYQIFDKLGAHFMTLDGIDGVLFAVWAPNAKRISVIGDFNSWDGRRNPMRSLENSGIWELFIPSLKQNDNYKFEIKSNDNSLLTKTDPFGSFQELRPGTASLVYNIDSYEWHDEGWLDKRNSKSPLNGPINIYEVHLGSWKRVADENNRFMSYLELADSLIPYVKEMGYTHIELMPVEEHPFDGSWGYQVTGYYAPTSRYGNPDEFKYFVDKCHQNGIGVLLDWVPAHFPKDAHGLAKFDGTALFEHADPKQGEHPDWGTLIFNFGRNEVKNFLIANAIFWIEKYHIDGLRVDAVASMLYLDYGKNDGEWVTNMYGGNENLEAVEFMKHMNSIILGKYPNVLMIAEESTAWVGVSRPAETGGLGFNLKWNMGWMNDFLTYISKEPVHRKYHHHSLTFSMVYAYTENFVLVVSHDEVVHGKGSLIGKMPGDLWQKLANARVSLGFMMGHPGKKLLFMGSEFGQFSEWSEERELDWFLLEFEHHSNLQTYVKDLNNLYKNTESLWYDDFNGLGFKWIDCNDADLSIVSFYRIGKSEKDITIFVCNFTPVPYLNHSIGVPFAGTFTEVLNSDDEKYGGSGIINVENLTSEPKEWNNFENSVNLKVPPLGMVVLRLA